MRLEQYAVGGWGVGGRGYGERGGWMEGGWGAGWVVGDWPRWAWARVRAGVCLDEKGGCRWHCCTVDMVGVLHTPSGGLGMVDKVCRAGLWKEDSIWVLEAFYIGPAVVSDVA